MQRFASIDLGLTTSGIDGTRGWYRRTGQGHEVLVGKRMKSTDRWQGSRCDWSEDEAKRDVIRAVRAAGIRTDCGLGFDSTKAP